MRIPGRLLLPPILLLAVLLLALACGDDDGNTSTPGPSLRSPTTRPSVTATVNAPDEKETPTPDAGDGEETTAPAEQTPPPPAAEGTPAIAPGDQGAFVSRFQGQPVSEEYCVYNPSTRVTDCGARGKYAVDPPLAGQDITCAVLVLNGEAAAIRCTSQEPLQTLYYEIQ